MGQDFKETARQNGDDEKFGNNMDRVKNLSESLKITIEFAGAQITLEDFARTYPDKFESAFQNQMSEELANQMALVFVHIIIDGN